MRSGLAGLVVLLALAGCGTRSAVSPAGDRNPAEQRLLAAADAAADRNGGKANHVEAVMTTRGTAADLTGHSSLSQDEELWVVQVSGDDYTCLLCSGPRGSVAPKGRYLTLVLRVSDYEGTDFAIAPKATDLAALGRVDVLRDRH
jgi:hypothetical protein